mmetsp:Transcript_27610/g.81728  ORF Transcript_27610/g.81728 Transcript_27610/m.81728 type:complete len:303 (-) Transcript_27610:1276-2184(-)
MAVPRTLRTCACTDRLCGTPPYTSMHACAQGPEGIAAGLMAVPRTLRMMYLHAYQSFVWNAAASHRVAAYGADAPVVGDLVLLAPAAVEAADGGGTAKQDGVDAGTTAERGGEHGGGRGRGGERDGGGGEDGSGGEHCGGGDGGGGGAARLRAACAAHRADAGGDSGGAAAWRHRAGRSWRKQRRRGGRHVGGRTVASPVTSGAAARLMGPGKCAPASWSWWGGARGYRPRGTTHSSNACKPQRVTACNLKSGACKGQAVTARDWKLHRPRVPVTEHCLLIPMPGTLSTAWHASRHEPELIP